MSELEQIQLYLEGKLNGDLLLAFEKRLSEDTTFKQEVDDMREASQIIEQLRKTTIENKVRGWAKELPNLPREKKPNNAISRSLFLRIAAAVAIVLVTVPAIYFGRNYFTDTTKALAEFQQGNYEKLILDLDRGTNTEEYYPLAEGFFDQDNYEECIRQLDNIKVASPTYPKAVNLKGHAFYKNGQYKKAIESFTEVKKFKGQNVKITWVNTEWTNVLAYLGLYLTEKNQNNKKQLTEQVNLFLQDKPEEYYKDKAEQLLKILD